MILCRELRKTLIQLQTRVNCTRERIRNFKLKKMTILIGIHSSMILKMDFTFAHQYKFYNRFQTGLSRSKQSLSSPFTYIHKQERAKLIAEGSQYKSSGSSKEKLRKTSNYVTADC